MKPTIAVKFLIASFFHSAGIVSTKIRNNSAETLALMYHRVIPIREAGDMLQDGMYVEPETFEIHVQFLLKYFRLVSIPELSNALRNKRRNSDHKPFCILTFDDGWYDFYRYAFPILKTFSVPATVFVPTDFIGTSKWFWTDRLMHLFFQRNRPAYSARISELSSVTLVNQLEAIKGSLEFRIERAIEILKGFHDDEIERAISELSTRWGFDSEPQGRAFLSWDEVREMKNSGLITFGSHTASHRILTILSDNEIEDELIRSKQKLIAEKAIDPTCIPFCYPNGNYNAKTAKLVKEMGYHLAVTTENGWNDGKADLFRLRRIGIHEDITSTKALFGCRITGIL